MRSIFIPEPQILSKFCWKFHIIFQIWEILVWNWWNWPYFHTNFRKFWKYDPCLYQFLNEIRVHRYTRRLILGPISAARRRIEPPSPGDTVMTVVHCNCSCVGVKYLGLWKDTVMIMVIATVGAGRVILLWLTMIILGTFFSEKPTPVALC